MKSNNWEKGKKRKAEWRGEGKAGERKRRGEKVSIQPSIPSLTTFIKLHFFPIKNVLHLVITISTLHKEESFNKHCLHEWVAW